jgi:hypothetical protein
MADSSSRTCWLLPSVLSIIAGFGFIAGCAAGAFLYTRLGFSAIVLPLILAILCIPLGELWE